MSEETQRKILENLYEKWKTEPTKGIGMNEFVEKGVLDSEKDWYANIEIMRSKRLIEEPFPREIRISTLGIDTVEDERLSRDIRIRRKILDWDYSLIKRAR